MSVLALALALALESVSELVLALVSVSELKLESVSELVLKLALVSVSVSRLAWGSRLVLESAFRLEWVSALGSAQPSQQRRSRQSLHHQTRSGAASNYLRLKMSR